MALFDEATWQRLLPRLRQRCPRLTVEDLAACERRGDLLVSRIQNRQWISVNAAQRLLLELMRECGRPVGA
jgi:hypothetical protein